MDLRCDHRLHGILKDGLLEIKCRDRYCGATEGFVVFHYFDPNTGQMKETRRFKDPAKRSEG